MSLDRFYSDTWETRNKRLCEINMSYVQYLKSEHWYDLKKKAQKRKNYQSCEICGDKNVELHHAEYSRLLKVDELRSIIALCRKHHEEVHFLSKKYDLSVRTTTSALRSKGKGEAYLINRRRHFDLMKGKT